MDTIRRTVYSLGINKYTSTKFSPRCIPCQSLSQRQCFIEYIYNVVNRYVNSTWTVLSSLIRSKERRPTPLDAITHVFCGSTAMPRGAPDISMLILLLPSGASGQLVYWLISLYTVTSDNTCTLRIHDDINWHDKQ